MLACASLARGQGQGQLVFANTSATLISTNAVHGGPATGPTEPYPGSGASQFFYALFAAPSTVTSVSGVMDANWMFTGNYATNIATAGRLRGYGVLPSPWGFGTTFNFLVRGWSSTVAGQDWGSVQGFISNFENDPNAAGLPGQFFGTSSIATIVQGGPAGPTAVLFGTTPGSTIQGFTLDQVPIPEPSIFAIIGLGALMFFRLRFKDRRQTMIRCQNNS
jgi:hypothetical protein